jgi:hypothetical protein
LADFALAEEGIKNEDEHQAVENASVGPLKKSPGIL